jgi:uncharacterized protein (TIRG00374 family)
MSTDLSRSGAQLPTTASRWSLFWLAVRALIGTSLLVYVLRGGAWSSLKGLFGLTWLVIAINLVPIAGAVIEAFRLRVLFGAQSLSVPIAVGFRLVSIGALFNLWIPGGTGGDVMKLYYLAQLHKGRGVEVATTLLVDRFVALFAMLCLILILVIMQLPSLSNVPTITSTAVGVAAALVVLVVVVATVWSHTIQSSRLVQQTLKWLPLGGYLERAAKAAYAFRARKLALVQAALISLSGHVLLAATLALVGRVLLPQVPPLLTCTLTLLGLIASALPITPGGLGVGEAAAEALFRSVGVHGGAAQVAAWRAGMIGISIIGAILYIAADKSPRRAEPAKLRPDRAKA